MGKHSKKRRIRRLMFAGIDDVVQINGIGWLVENVERRDNGVSMELSQGTSAAMKVFVGDNVLVRLTNPAQIRRGRW